MIPTQDRKPNILFILTDQQRRDSMQAYGNKWIKTPNLDKLANKSLCIFLDDISQIRKYNV